MEREDQDELASLREAENLANVVACGLDSPFWQDACMPWIQTRVNETVASLLDTPETGPRDAYNRGYAKALNDLQKHLTSLIDVGVTARELADTGDSNERFRP